MDCRTFRDRHLELLDGTLDELTLIQCERHRAESADCTRFDGTVRRGLLVAHNLAEITPSGGFSAKLALRLAAEREAQRIGLRRRRWIAGASVCALAGVAMLMPRTTPEPAAEGRLMGLGRRAVPMGAAIAVRAEGASPPPVYGRIDPALPHAEDSTDAGASLIVALPSQPPALPVPLASSPALATVSLDR